MRDALPCTLCLRAPRLNNSDWCRPCWQAWWTSAQRKPRKEIA